MRLRVVQGRRRDQSRGQLPSRRRDHHDASHHSRHSSYRRSSYRHRHASLRQRYANPHQRHASQRRSGYRLLRASRQHCHAHYRRHVRRHDGQRMMAQPNMPTTQPPPSALPKVCSCPSSEFCAERTTRPSSSFLGEWCGQRIPRNHTRLRSPPQRQQDRGKQQESAEGQPHPSLGQAAGKRDASRDRSDSTKRER
jgi:hypothetical protein